MLPHATDDHADRGPSRCRRHRDSLIRVASAHLLRLQKALDQMNVLLHRVVTDITGPTGLAILDAIVAGERDPRKLAAHRDHRCKKSEAEIAATLKGDWKVEQLFTLRQSLAAWRFHHQLADECVQEIYRLARQAREPHGEDAASAHQARQAAQ